MSETMREISPSIDEEYKPSFPEIDKAFKDIDSNFKDNTSDIDALESDKLDATTDTAWHEVGDSGEPAFENSWVNFGSGEATAAFRLDSDGFVHIKGVVKDGSAIGTDIFTLPSGYRPANKETFCCIANNAIARIQILSTGEVQTGVVGSTTWFSICGIIFKAA